MLRSAFPYMVDEDMAEFEERLKRYVAVLVRIAERTCRDKLSYPQRKHYTSRENRSRIDQDRNLVSN